MDLEDAPEFAALAIPKPSLALDDDQIVPQDQEFATIGHLYRGIEQGFRHLVEQYGEQRVFIGPPRAQATQESFGWPELLAVTDLASACQAIETIIQEGREHVVTGGRRTSADSCTSCKPTATCSGRIQTLSQHDRS
jgi:Ferritin-like